MKKSKLSCRNNLTLALLLWPAWLYAIASSGGDYNLTKTLIGASGVSQVISPDYSAAYCAGEDVAGMRSQSVDYDVVSGYLSAYASGITGTFSLVGATIGTTKILQDGFQVGVPLNATVQLDFSSPIDPATIPNGIQITIVMDHLGQPQNNIVPFNFTYDVIGTTVVISPQGAWMGNTVYDVAGTGSLRSIDGFALAPSPHPQFITVLDPHQENVVLHPIPINRGPVAPSPTNATALTLDIPQDALSDYAYVLMSEDPLHAPLQVDPLVLQAATQKGISSGGAYQTPLALEEIAAYNEQGRPVSLSKFSSFSVTYSATQSMVSGTNLPIHADTLSLWTLDTAHALWVKMPDTHSNGSGVLGPISQFSVYALMGSAELDASSVFVFPIPWRPHGPNAGSGAGETGTDSGGMTFSNLPSECSIKIYTLSGGLVRELQHSDLAGSVGQEKWDGNTSGGSHAASGVYLWRVESANDAKNGKLMLIR